MKRHFLAGLALVAGLVSTQSFAFGPDSFKIKSLIQAGSGCPAGSVASNVSPDREAFTLLFDSYIAETGPGVPFANQRRNCQLNISFECPAGWSFAIVELDTRGYVSLDPAISGEQKTTFYFQGSANQGSVSRTFYGPLDYDYNVRDEVAVTSRQWGRCGAAARSLNINTQVRLNSTANRFGRGVMTVDSIDGSLTQMYRLVWQRDVL